MRILGIWDGHDSGAALLVDGQVVAAVNEERLTRRKLEIRFPTKSIACCLELGGIAPGDVDVVAASTTDPAKTLGRWVPSTKEAYYRIRRRKADPGLLAGWKKQLKYRITEWSPTAWSHWASRLALSRELQGLGLGRARLEIVDHHLAHAAGAALASRFDPCLVLTVDGVGDGLSATVSRFENGRLQRIAATPARWSLGILFEHATNLLNMRELEDEGKVMALADHTYPVPDEENGVLSLIAVEGLEFRTRRPGHSLRQELAKIHWRCSAEQFAYQVQRAVELRMVEWVRAAIRETGLHRIALAGGVASNVKASQKIRLMPEVEDIYVFPHMGDGGLALGAAAEVARATGEPRELDLSDLQLGPGFDDDEIERVLRESGLPYERVDDIVPEVADLIASGAIVLWFQGRMEYGPRALGGRSVLARPDRPDLRDRLNLVLKRRSWFQPFCPSILESEAWRVIEDFVASSSRHMTMAYTIAPAFRPSFAGVTAADWTCRPQVVADDSDCSFARLLNSMRHKTGIGAVLNTSLNHHGAPLVCNPSDAVSIVAREGSNAMMLGNFLAVDKRSVSGRAA